MEMHDVNNFEEFEDIKPKNRRALLPWWIKFFCWVFMIFGGIACLSPIQLLFGRIPELSFYGFDSHEAFPFFLILLYPIFILNGLTGYLLWFEKDKGVDVGKICVYVGIALCIISTIWSLVTHSRITFRLEIIPLIIFYRKLSDIEYNWYNS